MDFGDGSTTGYYAVAQWAALTTKSAGALVRQLAAPAVGSERVFVLVVGNVASGAAEPAWTLTRGAKTTDSTETWQECTGIAAINGDFSANTPTWATVKNTAVTLGQVINDVARSIVLICTTAGTAGNGAEPAWNAYTTAGATTADNTVTWTNIGVVGNFTGWQAPHARLENAYAGNWGQAGNSFFVASEHAQTKAAATTLTSPGTTAKPCSIYCTAKTPVPPTSTTTGASITTTGANRIFISTYALYVGINFVLNASNAQLINLGQASNGTDTASCLSFVNCAFTLQGALAHTLNVGHESGGSGACRVDWNNTTVSFSNTGQTIQPWGAVFRWKNTASAVIGAAVPTSLLSPQYPGSVLCEGVDLSGITAGNTIVAAGTAPTEVILKDCKITSGVTVAATPSDLGGNGVSVTRTDSAATDYIEQRYVYVGTQVDETTIVRTGGATDGTTPIAKKITTTANSKWAFPFELPPRAIWNNTTGSTVNVTIYGIWGGGAVPNNDDIWIDVEYLGASGNPQGSFTTLTKASGLSANAALASDTSSWGGSTTPFKMTVAVTPQLKGYIYVYVKAAKASTTFYIDPAIVLS